MNEYHIILVGTLVAAWYANRLRKKYIQRQRDEQMRIEAEQAQLRQQAEARAVKWHENRRFNAMLDELGWVGPRDAVADVEYPRVREGMPMR